MFVTVESSSSESESRSESDSESSDSDDLESWMILGQGKQEGDHCISINLEGGSESESGASCVSLVLFVAPVCTEKYLCGKVFARFLSS